MNYHVILSSPLFCIKIDTYVKYTNRQLNKMFVGYIVLVFLSILPMFLFSVKEFLYIRSCVNNCNKCMFNLLLYRPLVKLNSVIIEILVDRNLLVFQI